METLDILSVPRPVGRPAIPATDLVPAATTTVAPSPMTIKQAAIAYIQAREPEVVALVAKYQGVALDLSTPKALAAGKAQRTEVREKGRLQIQRDRDGLKDVLNAAKKDAEAEADRLISLVKPVEDHLQAQIDAREAVLAAEKAERERIAAEAAAKEAARVQMHRDNIAKIRGYVAQAQGASAAKLQAAVEFVANLEFSAEWEEFCDEAANTREETVAALLVLRDAALAREAEAARVKAQAEENARVAAELAEQKRQLDEQAAALKKQQDEAEAQRVAAEKAEAQRLADMERERQQAEAKRIQAENDHAAALRTSLVLPADTVAYIAENGSNTEQVEAQYAAQVAVENAAMPVQTINRSTRKAITAEPVAPSVDTATPAELRNEWALFLEALQRVEPAIKKHAAFVDHTRYIRALDRFAGMFV